MRNVTCTKVTWLKVAWRDVTWKNVTWTNVNQMLSAVTDVPKNSTSKLSQNQFRRSGNCLGKTKGSKPNIAKANINLTVVNYP